MRHERQGQDGRGVRVILTVGSHGAEVTTWQQWFNRKYASYAPPVDGYFGNADRDATRILQSRLGVPVTGQFDDVTAAKAGYPGAKPVAAHRPIWMYTMPGSGAPGNVGPPFLVGEDCRNILHINHQWVGYPIGGYLGLMGGDPAYSYIDVCAMAKAELRRLLHACPDIGNPAWEGWFVGYSQGAEAMLLAMAELFGDGGEFAHLRSRINGVICFGNPATQGTGIARRILPDWLNRLTRNINHPNDFYAVANDKIRPLFYEWFVKAETEIPFVVYSAQIILPAIAGLMPGIGQLISAPLSLLLSVIPGGAAGASQPPNPKLIELLSVQGLLTSLPDLVGLIAALPGLQAHGMYDHRPGYDIVAAFRR